MLLSVKHLNRYSIEATDGYIGHIHGFLFDDRNWKIRYVVVDTGKWLPGRKVLLAPAALDQPDGAIRAFPIGLTRRQVEDSPDIDTERPVSRQQEIELHAYYNWASYWGDTFSPIHGGDRQTRKPMQEEQAQQQQDNPHLRSTREVIGYRIHAADGEIGHVDDFIVNTADWIIQYVVADTRQWLPGKTVLIPVHWIKEIRWSSTEVAVDVTRQAVTESPEFDPASPVNREYEIRLYDYYGRPAYWL